MKGPWSQPPIVDQANAAITGGVSQWNDGAAATPSIAWAAEPTNGFYRPSAGSTAWAGGAGSLVFGSNNGFGSISGRNNANSTTSWSITDAGDVTFGAAGAKTLFLTAPRHVAFNTGALATGATGGFVSIPSSAGLQTGVPANIPTGQCPFVYDSTNNKLMVYNGSWRSTAALT